MWLCHVTRRNIIVMLQLLCFLPEQMIHIRAHYVCEVGQEKDRDGIWRWVLPYQHPCKCTSIRYGGMNTITPKRPFEPVYVNKPLVGDNIQKIIQHYNLDCTDPWFETCPADFEIQTDMGKPTGMVVYNTPPASDNSGYVSVMCEPPSRSDIHIGQNRITCEALDSSGNSAICEFTVDARDLENPLFTNCRESYQVQTDPGNSTAVVIYQPPTATDNSGEVVVTCAPPSESVFAMGQTIITCDAQDSSGNNATCRFIVDVKDEEDPSISVCPADQEMVTDTGNPTAVATYQPPTATDNSGKVNVTCAPPSESELAIGPNNVVCTAQDGSENSVSCEFTVDVKDEEYPLISACPAADVEMQTDPGNATAVVTYQPPTATDNSGEVTVTCAPPSKSEFSIGLNIVVCTAQDRSENSDTCEFTVNVKDKEDPVVGACPEGLQIQTDPTKSTTIVTYQAPDATDNSGEVIVTCAPQSGSEFAIGPNIVVCTAQDGSENSDTCEFTINVKDEEDPIISPCPGSENVQVPTDPGKSTAVVSFQATDNSGQVTLSCEPPSETEFEMGQTNVTCTAQDPSENNVTCGFEVDVRDAEKPLFSACPDFNKNTDSGNATAVVTYRQPNATDNSGEVMIVTCAPLSATYFVIGQTGVICTTQDNSGNIATCDFTVNVKDDEDPVIGPCPGDFERLTDFGKPYTQITYDKPNATDNSGQVTVECPLTFYIGQTNATCTAKDSSGNTATCGFLVDVKDEEAPVIKECRANYDFHADPGNSTAFVTYQQPPATDNSGKVTLKCDPPSATYFEIGTTTITCIATDSSGNNATCEFQVYIRDNCRQRLGVEDGRVTDLQLNASSEFFVYHGARNARLNQVARHDNMLRSTGAWSAGANDLNQWIQASLGVQKWVSGVLLQGRQDCCDQNGQWVTKFKVEYSDDGTNWVYVQTNKSDMVFDGNTDRDTITTSIFLLPVQASGIRIRPTAWKGHISLRFELLGCELTPPIDVTKIQDTCQKHLGVENGDILDDHLTASTEYQHAYHGAHNARLNRISTSGTTGAWSAQISNDQQWIQVALGIPKWITGVLLQGRGNCNCHQWVTRFKVKYRVDGETWKYVRQTDNHGDMIFDGNTDQNSVVTRFFPKAVKASLIQIQPTHWNAYISMRFELLGCEDMCKTGWPVVNRAYVDSPGYTMVSPDKQLCSGQVTKWTYQGKQEHTFRAIIFRPVSGSDTEFQIVGINDIPLAGANFPVEYSVPEAERITVAEGDVIGWSLEYGVIAWDDGESERVRWSSEHQKDDLQANQILEFHTSNVQPRQYSIEATVEITPDVDTAG